MFGTTRKKPQRSLASDDYLAMSEEATATPGSGLTTAGDASSSTRAGGSGSAVPSPALPRPASHGVLFQRLTRFVFRRRTPPAASNAHDIEAQRQHWATERSSLLEDCTAIRAEAAALDRVMQGWSMLVRDLIFYGVLHGKSEQLVNLFTEQLRSSLGEVEGVHEVEISELRVPMISDYAPQLLLLSYHGPELSEWGLHWQPPTAQAGGAITLRGRKFGVSFSITVVVGGLQVQGHLICKWSPGTAEPALTVGFKQLPQLHFELSLAGKALSLGSETLRAWLQRQVCPAPWSILAATLAATISLATTTAHHRQHCTPDAPPPPPLCAPQHPVPRRHSHRRHDCSLPSHLMDAHSGARHPYLGPCTSDAPPPHRCKRRFSLTSCCPTPSRSRCPSSTSTSPSTRLFPDQGPSHRPRCCCPLHSSNSRHRRSHSRSSSSHRYLVVRVPRRQAMRPLCHRRRPHRLGQHGWEGMMRWQG